MNNSVMIVEDEAIVSMQIKNYVESLGYNVVSKVSNADDAIKEAIIYNPDITLMDIHIKNEKDGVEAASEINKKINTSIIYLTAYCDDDTINRALETEPIAYLLKPLNKSELMVAMKIAMNKYNETSLNTNFDKNKISLGDEFVYDIKNQQLSYRNEYIHLTKKENTLLTLLLESKNNIVSIYDIENEIWPDKLANENTRRSLVSRLRTKLNYKFIETIAGIGYRINI